MGGDGGAAPATHLGGWQQGGVSGAGDVGGPAHPSVSPLVQPLVALLPGGREKMATVTEWRDQARPHAHAHTSSVAAQVAGLADTGLLPWGRDSVLGAGGGGGGARVAAPAATTTAAPTRPRPLAATQATSSLPPGGWWGSPPCTLSPCPACRHLTVAGGWWRIASWRCSYCCVAQLFILGFVWTRPVIHAYSRPFAASSLSALSLHLAHPLISPPFFPSPAGTPPDLASFQGPTRNLWRPQPLPSSGGDRGQGLFGAAPTALHASLSSSANLASSEGGGGWGAGVGGVGDSLATTTTDTTDVGSSKEGEGEGDISLRLPLSPQQLQQARGGRRGERSPGLRVPGSMLVRRPGGARSAAARRRKALLSEVRGEGGIRGGVWMVPVA